MADIKKKIPIVKEKFLGEVKEAVGKASGNETLELEGKIQTLKADIKEKINIGEKAAEIKEEIAGLINDSIDKIKDNDNKAHTGKTKKH